MKSAAPRESSLTDILVRKALSSSSSSEFLILYLKLETVCFLVFLFLVSFLAHCLPLPEDTVDPQILVELFSIYREWQDSKAQDITNRQVRSVPSSRLNGILP